jgi:hypothetical protein
MRANSEIGRQIDGAVVDGRHLTNAQCRQRGVALSWAMMGEGVRSTGSTMMGGC